MRDSDNRALPYLHLLDENVPQFVLGMTNYSVFPDLKTIEPHRHDYQTIIWTHSGTGKHIVDDKTVKLAPNTFSMIAKGQVHQFIEIDRDFALTSIRFNDAFLPESTFGQVWSYRAALFNHQAPLHQSLSAPSAEVHEIESLFELMKVEYDRTKAFRKDDGLRFLLQFLLLRIARIQQQSVYELSSVNVADYDLFRIFVSSLEIHFAEHHSVQYYAAAVNTTAGKLSELTKQVLGKSAKEVILDRVYLEAKRFLSFSKSSVKQIAFALGYDNPDHFSRAFKNHEQISPVEYREQNIKMV